MNPMIEQQLTLLSLAVLPESIPLPYFVDGHDLPVEDQDPYSLACTGGLGDVLLSRQ